ncbi:glycoside hydrolase family 30 protein [Thermoflavifilum thermophilum]|uniref:Glucosylceramidase n=1 Tax=Thermoflavifilum thermophilum TaxID=1393122 RepID=A0A1I7MYR2_9BACT|nr:glycoside hydrolase family 30 beta sandwich domain-containing protein [Thermoflavifilum thermophilum]SFV27531.1 glucosylceramidase [Thermoflavifilum thermophilum]
MQNSFNPAHKPRRQGFWSWIFPRSLRVVCTIALISSIGYVGCAKSTPSHAQAQPPADSTPSTPSPPVQTDVAFYLTTPDRSQLLARQNVALLFSAAPIHQPVIEVDTTQTFQTMDGFGFALTGGSAYLINKLPPNQQNALLQELFGNDSNSIHISYIRISIGASDLNRAAFTYDDMPAGQTDTALQYFNLGADQYDLIPVLQKIVQINPHLHIIATPWSAPAWMKTNHSLIGGSLDTAFYGVYARYFVKYLQAMQAQGIPIEAITPQNEPLYGGNNPSMVMQAEEELRFVRDYLGPALRRAGLPTKIVVYDHNCDRPDYPLTILQDSIARQYVDGSAFHLYAGNIAALTQVHDAYPDKNVYFTEQWTGGPDQFGPNLAWDIQNLIIGATRNWSRCVIKWNLAADPNYQPHTPGGCSSCLGALTIGSDIVRNSSYYSIAHASKFVPSGSVRVYSTDLPALPNVAFLTPDGYKVLIVYNPSSADQAFQISFRGKQVSPTLPAGAVATFVWK